MRVNLLSSVLLVLCLLGTSQAATTTLRLLGQMTRPGASNDDGTEQVVFDDKQKVAYLVGGASLFVVNLEPAALLDNGSPAATPKNLATLQTVTFETTVNDVAFCGRFLAVSNNGNTKVDNGTVTIYHRYLRTPPSSGPGSLEKVATFPVGALPDQLTFSKDCKTILVSNEGEPSSYPAVVTSASTLATDPEGSVSIIKLDYCAHSGHHDEAELEADEPEEPEDSEEDVAGSIERKHRKSRHHYEKKACVYTGVTGTVRTATFTSFNGQEQALMTAGVKINGPGASVAQDLEPEFTTFSEDESIAFVSLQENNAVAVLDVETATFRAIYPLSFKDHSQARNIFDPTDTPKQVTINAWPVSGMYQPDEMKSFRYRGCDYLVTANEGDARSYSITGDDKKTWSEERRVKGLQTANKLDSSLPGYPTTYNDDEKLGRLNVLTSNGEPLAGLGGATVNTGGKFNKLFSYGARSFSIWKYEENKGRGQRGTYTFSQVYDSGADLELISANATYGIQEIYNSQGKTGSDGFDTRSDNKGPEPEGLAIGPCSYKPRGYGDRNEKKERLCLFLGTERLSCIFVYDITDPANPVFQSVVRPPQPDINSLATRLTAPEGMTYERYSFGSNSFAMVLAAFEGQKGDATGLGVYQVVRA